MNEDVTLRFWTGFFRCCGGEVGGNFVVSVTPEEKAWIESCRQLNAETFTEKLQKEKPDLWKRIDSVAAEAFDIQRTEEVYGEYDFSDKKFEGWTYEQQIDYIRHDVDPELAADDVNELLYEVPKKDYH